MLCAPKYANGDQCRTEEITRYAVLVLWLLKNSSETVMNSGAWAEIDRFDQVYRGMNMLLLMLALYQLQQLDQIQILGVESYYYGGRWRRDNRSILRAHRKQFRPLPTWINALPFPSCAGTRQS